MVLCAAAITGTNSTPIIIPTMRFREVPVDIALLAFLQHESTYPTPTPKTTFLCGQRPNYTDDRYPVKAESAVFLVGIYGVMSSSVWHARRNE